MRSGLNLIIDMHPLLPDLIFISFLCRYYELIISGHSVVCRSCGRTMFSSKWISKSKQQHEIKVSVPVWPDLPWSMIFYHCSLLHTVKHNIMYVFRQMYVQMFKVSVHKVKFDTVWWSRYCFMWRLGQNYQSSTS